MVEARATSVEPDFAARQSILMAIAWLVGGVTVALALRVLEVRPDLGGDLAFLSYGRVRGVAETAIVFGWLATAGFAAIYALIPRIADIQLHNEVLGAATTLTWSVILTGGILAVLLGFSQGRLLGELPSGADLGMTLMLVFVLFNASVTIVRRREKTLYVSGWFLLSAAILAPVVFIIGNLPVFEGVTDAIVAGFYLNGIEMLWLLPLGLGVAYYVVPVETGKALYSVALARTSFWSLVFAGGWAGQRFFLKGPGPDYLETIAVAMTVVLLLPVVSAAANLYATGRDRWDLIARSYGLRFAATGLALLVAWMVLLVFSNLPSVSRFVGLTAWTSGVRHLALFGVFSSFAFALVYHLYPLMVGRDWFSRSAASFHFWTTQIGVIVGTVALLTIGAAQSITNALGPATPAVDATNVIGLLRVVVAASFAAVVVAQYALAYNTFKTSRSGPFVVPPTTAPAAIRGSA
jgi:cbb3-type cytochrome oxidase subunit 1